MKRIMKRALALCICPLLLVACTSVKDSDGVPPESASDISSVPVAMGRYRETQLELPAGSVSAISQVGPDTFTLMIDNWEDPEDPKQVWQSTDGAETWERLPVGWTDAEGLTSPVAFTAEGNAYVALMEGDFIEGTVEQFLAFADDSGIRKIASTGPSGSRAYLLTDSGGLLVENNEGMELWDDAGNIRHTFPVIAGAMGSSQGIYTTHGSTLAALNDEGDAIVLYDLETGEKTGQVPCAAGQHNPRVIAHDREGGAYFYVDQSGLYRVTPDGVITEQVIDGRLASFGMPTEAPTRLFQRGDGGFLVLCRETLFGYVFDPSLSTVPSQELTMYTLRDNLSARSIAGTFMRDNPDVLVDIRTGIPDTGGVELADALRTLSTELLAGNGPDILLLDDLAIDTYSRHGILADLSDLASSANLTASVAQAYAQNGEILAIPMEYTVPAIAGVGIGGIGDLSGLVDFLETGDNPRMPRMREGIVEWFYDLCAYRWFSAAGEIDSDAIRVDLEALQAYGDLQDAHPWPESGSQSVDHITGQAVYWSNDALPLMIGKLDSAWSTAEYYTAIDARGEGTIRLFPTAAGGLFLPHTILGVNQASQHTELAKELVAHALSGDCQSLLVIGFPVNRQVLEKQMNQLEPEAGMFTNKLTNPETGDEYLFRAKWFTPLDRAEALELLTGVRVPAYSNAVLHQITLEEAAPYCRGDVTLEDAVEGITRRARLYLDEQG